MVLQETAIQVKGYTGVIGEGWSQKEIVKEVGDNVVEGMITALRIAGQPPYGYVFRVDDKSLVERVWELKGRVDGGGKVDFSKKPVTSLSKEQLFSHVDWEKLFENGFSRSEVMNILMCDVHTVLPVNRLVPEHLVSITDSGPTVSTFMFKANTVMGDLTRYVSDKNSDSILGGTSLNPSGKPAYVSSEDALSDAQSLGIDFMFLSEPTCSEDVSVFHPMVSLGSNKTVSILRKGINYKSLLYNLKDVYGIIINEQ